MIEKVLGLVLVASVAAACSSSPDAADEEGGGDGHIQLQVSGEPEETAVYSSMAEQFMEANDGVHVEVVEVPE